MTNPITLRRNLDPFTSHESANKVEATQMEKIVEVASVETHQPPAHITTSADHGFITGEIVTYEYSGRALIFGASGGIGLAFSKFLENKLGVENVVKVSRSFDGFEISDEESVFNFSEKIFKVGFEKLSFVPFHDFFFMIRFPQSSRTCFFCVVAVGFLIYRLVAPICRPILDCKTGREIGC